MDTQNISHRKAQVELRCLDAAGQPLAHQTVYIEQKQHAFLFACGAFETMHIVEAEDEASRSFYEQRYELWLKLFNSATLPFYWGRFEPKQGQTIATTLEKMALYLRQKEIVLKGHPLCWHTNTAPWLLDYDIDEALALQLERIRRDVRQFKPLIHIWDVINEVVIMPEFDKYDNAITRICKKMGRVALVKKVFAAAREADPDALLLINDFNTTQRYEHLIEECLEAGIPIDAIGIQSHQHQGYWGDEKLEDVLQRFSRFNLPLHFTENTFISGSLMPPHIVDLNDYQVDSWPTETEAEYRQAQDIERWYRRLFAHPQVEAITTWAFQDNAWLHAPAGLVREDNSTKPGYHALDELLNKEWKTKIVLRTDEAGRVSFEGFKGKYEARIDAQHFSFSTDDGSVVFRFS